MSAWVTGLLPLPTVWISLYYVGFYVVMTGIFALCIYTLMCTLDPYTPDYQDQLKSPGNRARGWHRGTGTPRVRAMLSPPGRTPGGSLDGPFLLVAPRFWRGTPECRQPLSFL